MVDARQAANRPMRPAERVRGDRAARAGVSGSCLGIARLAAIRDRRVYLVVPADHAIALPGPADQAASTGGENRVRRRRMRFRNGDPSDRMLSAGRLRFPRRSRRRVSRVGAADPRRRSAAIAAGSGGAGVHVPPGWRRPSAHPQSPSSIANLFVISTICRILILTIISTASAAALCRPRSIRLSSSRRCAVAGGDKSIIARSAGSTAAA